MQDPHTKAAENHDGARRAHRAVTVPQFINEDKSDMRGIKSGWYARDNTGNLVSGPFVSREQCVERICRDRYLQESGSSSSASPSTKWLI
jgi:hypothetical protein